MRLNAVDNEGISSHKHVRPLKNRGNAFSRLLENHAGDRNGFAVDHKPPGAPKMTFLGTISRASPTVSDLLVKHPAYKKDIWRIVHSGENQEKPFTRMQAGTKVYIVQDTQEIIWDRFGRSNQTMNPGLVLKDEHPTSNVQRPKSDKETKIALSPRGERLGAKGEKSAGEQINPEAKKAEPVMLGTISRENPTASDLLFRNPSYRKDAWEIVHAENNRGKPYTKMRAGTKVYLDPENLEIFWNRKSLQPTAQPRVVESKPSTPATASRPEVDEEDAFSEGLADAVEPYLGKPYEELDCYQLVVQGLEKLGVKYEGKGGLAEQLIKTAVSRGLPRNAYLNGEGLIRNSGSLIYAKSFPRVGRPEGEAREIFDQIKPLLKKGFILSFSTPTRGHTGIVSKRDGAWTYINSGNMDHQLESRSAAKGVGEEFLNKEIDNWFKLAFDRNESLQVTLGRLNEAKLRSAMI